MSNVIEWTVKELLKGVQPRKTPSYGWQSGVFSLWRPYKYVV